ncbi:MAG: c-type cytochrome biogenesis protein CcmI [Formivibrio sp.]|nr:c-type cytochrome biogenesis protein CcmI [Formivibrio sp.]
MTLTFWIAAAALMALVIALLAWPLLRHRPSPQTTSRRAINIALYRDQLAELSRDRDNGFLTPTDFDQAKEELDRRILEDTADELTSKPSKLSSKMPRTPWVLLFGIPLMAVPLYLFLLGNPAALTPRATAAAKENPDQQMTPEKFEKLTAILAAKLEKEPDPKGWVMLGRSYKLLGRFEDAQKAFTRAGSIMETEPVLMQEQVELVALMNQGRLSGKPLDLLQKLLQQEPDNPVALMYAGSNAFFGQKYAEAIAYWERLLKQVDPASEDAKNINGSIAKAQKLMLSQPSASAGRAEKITDGTAIVGHADQAPVSKSKKVSK